MLVFGCLSGDGGLGLGLLETRTERFAFSQFAVGTEVGQQLSFFYPDVVLGGGH